MFILVPLFFLSGFTALLYQVSWQRLLMLFVGSDAYSVTIVITVFLFGLGVGSCIGGRFADRLTTARALLAYAALECGIGVYAMMTPALFGSPLFQNSLLSGADAYTSMAACFLFLLLPTVMMGMTLPCLSRAVIRKSDPAAKKSSELYAINIIGAAVGSLVCGWYLAGSYGYHNSIYIGAAINILIALIAFAFYRSRIYSNYHIDQIEDQHQFDQDLSSIGDQVARRWYLVFFISGFIAISLEIVWFRIMSVFYGSGPYLFSTLLFFFLLFDGLGTFYAIKKLHKVKNSYSLVLMLQGLICCYAIASIYFLSENHFYHGALATVTLPFVLLAVPAFMIGMSFPVIQAAIQGDERFTSQKIGYMQAVNIFGNALAGILTGLIFLEYVGSSGAVRIIAAIGFIAMLYSLFWNPEKNVVRIIVLVALPAFIFFMPSNADLWKGIKSDGNGDNKTMFFHESASGTSFLMGYGNNEGVTVYINGSHQGGIPYGAGHIYMGVFPGLIHSDAKDILVIGFGSGATAYGLGIAKNAETIDVIEIIRGHIRFVEKYIKEVSYISKSMFDDPRFNFIEADGRNFLKATEKKYDLIEADVIHPVKSGSGFVYSREFFSEVSAKLKPNGMMAQWNPTKRVQQTFLSVFPYVVSLNGYVLLGSNQPIHVDRKKLLSQDSIRRVADHFGISEVEASIMLNDFLAGDSITYWNPEDLRVGDINTDAHPKDEYILNTDPVAVSNYVNMIRMYFQ